MTAQPPCADQLCLQRFAAYLPQHASCPCQTALEWLPTA
jgi:hypothetical protein